MQTAFPWPVKMPALAWLFILTGWFTLPVEAGGPMGIDGGVAVGSGGTVNLTPTLAANYVAGKTGWIRVNMILTSGHTTWDSTELGYYDTAINNARAAGLQVLILMNNQGWTGGQSSWNADNFETTGGTGDNAYIDGWVNGVVVPIVQHFHDRVKVFEIWNEPSTWSGSSTNAGVVSYSGASYMYPSGYSWLLSKSWLAAHVTLGYGDVKIISGGVFGTSALGAADPGGNSGANYVAAFYGTGTNAATGAPFTSARNSYGTYPLDGIGQHIYIDYNLTTTGPHITQYLNLIRSAYTNFEGAHTAKETYVTEFGWTTASVSRQIQANNLATAFEVFEVGSSYVPLAIWFNWQDSPSANLYFGVFDQNGNPKTAYVNYQFYQAYEGYYTNGAIAANIQNYFNARGQAAMGDAFDNGASAFVHTASGGSYPVLAQDFAGGSHQNLTIFDTGNAMPWYMYPICVPFNNTNYDTQYGGSHDMDVQTPPGTPITSIVSGTVSSVTQPAWGWQIGIQLDTPIVNGNTNAVYFAYLHLGAVKPGLVAGEHVNFGDLIAYSGGANSTAQLGGNTNTPFGPQFLDAAAQSSQPQTGIALMRGPEYGVGAGWTTLPDPTLDPDPTLNQVRAKYPASGTFEVDDLHGLWTWFNAHGGLGAFGPPLDNEFATGNGSRQDFANGSLLWNSTSGVVTNVALVSIPAFAATGMAAGLTAANATLRGLVLPNGTNTSAWFEWGTNNNYGLATGTANAGTGYQVVPVTVGIGNLTAATIYHFRLVASNAWGTTYGSDTLFTTGGRVKTWGDGSRGQTNLPANLTNMVGVASGAYHALALKNDGTIVAWGYNNFGQTNVPAALSNVIAVAAGFYHSLALKTNGTMVVWGGNTFGQTNLPAGVSNVVAIAAGAYHSLALKSDGTVVAWGYDNLGQTNVPAGLANAVGIAAGLYHNIALKADGTVTAWGYDAEGETNVPVNLANVIAVSAGQYHNLALKKDGTVVAWGRNNLGQTNVPTGLTNVMAIACGYNFNLALKSDGTMVTWGGNGLGQTSLPPRLTNVAQLAGGMNSGVAIGNQAPLANGQTVSGFINHDLLIGLSGAAPDGNSLTYRIAGLPSAGTLYQQTNGGRGGSINTPGTPVIDGGGQVFFAPVTNQSGTPYAIFTFIANDGLNDSPPALITMNLGLPAMPRLGNTIWTGNVVGIFSLTFNGSSNATYRIWASTNLLDWDSLGTAVESPPGIYQFTDPAATNRSARFYRAGAP